jgi:hypothetical protein
MLKKASVPSRTYVYSSVLCGENQILMNQSFMVMTKDLDLCCLFTQHREWGSEGMGGIKTHTQIHIYAPLSLHMVDSITLHW